MKSYGLLPSDFRAERKAIGIDVLRVHILKQSVERELDVLPIGVRSDIFIRHITAERHFGAALPNTARPILPTDGKVERLIRFDVKTDVEISPIRFSPEQAERIVTGNGRYFFQIEKSTSEGSNDSAAGIYRHSVCKRVFKGRYALFYCCIIYFRAIVFRPFGGFYDCFFRFVRRRNRNFKRFAVKAARFGHNCRRTCRQSSELTRIGIHRNHLGRGRSPFRNDMHF